MTKMFGFLSTAHAQKIDDAMSRSDILYQAAFDRQALWDPTTIDKILGSFPKGFIDESDLFLILAECIANAVLHGQAEVLGFHARQRAGVILLSFYQIPSMQGRVGVVLSLARSGQIKECTTELPGGLGFPILLRLVHRITISNDYSKLQLWVRVNK